MKPLIFCVVLISLISSARSEEPTFDSDSEAATEAESLPWENNRLTTDQPFPARVVGVMETWVGIQLLLEEIETDSPRYCYVFVALNRPLKYLELSKEESTKFMDRNKIQPGVLVSEFSHDGVWKLGSRFGEKDLLLRAITRTKRVEQEAEKLEKVKKDVPAAKPARQLTIEMFQPYLNEQHNIGDVMKAFPEPSFFNTGGAFTWVTYKLADGTSLTVGEHMKASATLTDAKGEVIKSFPFGKATSNP
jgi:hypothetical protein